MTGRRKPIPWLPGALAAPAAVLLATALLATAVPALGQERLEERIGSAEAPIYEDNLDSAKSRAVRGAQQNAISQLLARLLAPEWRTLFRAELQRSILAHSERYIGSYRIQRLQASLDRTRYFATVYAQVNRNRLVADLRRLALPVKGDPARKVLVFYPAADRVLSATALRQEVLRALRERMALLNFTVRGIQPLRGPGAELLANPYAEEAARGKWLRKRKIAAGLFVSFKLKADSTDAEQSGGAASAAAHLYQAGNGMELGTFSVKAKRAIENFNPAREKSRKAVLTSLVMPLVAQLQPGGIKAFGTAAGKALPLRLRVLGLTSVEDEESFARAFFRPETQFGSFFLSRLDRKTVTYRGRFTGDRRSLELELPGRTYGEFRIRHVFWFDDVLEIDVERDARPAFSEIKVFPRRSWPAPVARIIDSFLEGNPELKLEDPAYTEREDNGWLARANPLAFNATVYGFIDSRGDADFYVGEELKENEVLKIAWYRMGRTKLNPAIRMYDGRGRPIRFYHPKFWIRTRYKVPKGQHRIFIEVSDRFGEIKWDSGGYLNYHYLLQVERSGTD